MKRGTPRHPKIQDLQESLGMPLYSCVGILELLWHFAAEHAPQGDVGRYADKRIEAAIGWYGGAGKVVRALLAARWLDSHPVHRLLIHDWGDHADESVRRKLSRAGLTFLSIQQDTQKVTGYCTTPADSEPDMSRPPEPYPVHNPEPEPRHIRMNGADRAYEVWFEGPFWPEYWRHTAKASGKKALAKHATSDEARASILAAMLSQKPGYMRRDTEKRPYLSTWANQERFNDEPEVFENGAAPKTTGQAREDRVMELFEERIQPYVEQRIAAQNNPIRLEKGGGNTQVAEILPRGR